MSTIWTTRDGRRIPIVEMDDVHLVNAANFALRELRRRLEAEAYDLLAYACATSAEMASYYAESSADDKLRESRTIGGLMANFLAEEGFEALVRAMVNEVRRRDIAGIDGDRPWQFCLRTRSAA